MKRNSGFVMKVFMLMAAVMLYGSCAQAPVAPAFNLYNYNRVAIIPFDNNTHDPALSGDIQESLTGKVLELNAIPIVDSARVAAYLKTIKAKASDVATDDNLRKKVAQNFKCNLLFTGSVEGYTETFKDTAPERLRKPNSDEMEWGFFSKRKVVVDFTVNLMDSETGSLLWKNKGNGYSWFNKWNPLPVPGNVAVPEQLGKFANFANMINNRVNNKPDTAQPEIDRNPDGALIYTKNPDFVGLRNDAIDAAVGSVMGDFKGRHGWVPGGAVK